MSSIDTSFPQFALFPFEIRRLIWCCCLPRRVVRLRRHSHRMWWDKCSTSIQFHRRHLPPLIAHVCSESRAVALQHGALRSNISHAAAFAMNYAWVDTLRDVVLVDGWFDQRMFDEPGHLACIAKTAPEVALAAWLFEGRPARTLEFVTVPRRQGGLMVVVREYVVHATEAEAVRSGLFGLWAEERLVLVPLRDEVRLARYRGMRRSLAGSQQLYRDLPERFPDPDFKLEDIHELLKLAWVECHADDAPKTIDGVVDPDVLTQNEEGRLAVSDFDHPWIKETLSTMPPYELVVLIQLCTRGDHLEELNLTLGKYSSDIDMHSMNLHGDADYYVPPSDDYQYNL